PRSVDLSTLRNAGNGGEPVRQSSIEVFEERFGIPGRVLPGYGLAEATLTATAHVPGDEIVVDDHGNVSLGRVIAGLELAAGDSPISPEEICVRGDSVFAGYFDAPDETAEVLRDGWFHTGDSGYVDDRGNLYVLGRRATLIKRAGGAIAPRELEEAAQRVPGLRVVAAVGLPAGDADGDDVVTVVAEADLEGPDEEQGVLTAISREVANAVGFAPGRVVIVPRGSVPRTHNGKVRHARLREALLEGAAV